MDLRTVTQALAELRQQRPHLPAPPGLARTVVTAWTSAGHTVVGPPGPLGPLAPVDGPMLAVLAVTWPIGAAAGAERGHRVASTVIGDMVSTGLADQAIDPQGRWVIWAANHAAQRLPVLPDTSEVTRRFAHLYWAGPPDLDAALAIGLGHSWLAGHRDATERVVDRFAGHVSDLVGDATLATTFLNAYLTGADVVRAVETAAFHAAQRDQDNPPPLTDPAPSRIALRAARAFTPICQIDPRAAQSPNFPQTPPSGSGRGPAPGR